MPKSKPYNGMTWHVIYLYLNPTIEIIISNSKIFYKLIKILIKSFPEYKPDYIINKYIKKWFIFKCKRFPCALKIHLCIGLEDHAMMLRNATFHKQMFTNSEFVPGKAHTPQRACFPYLKAKPLWKRNSSPLSPGTMNLKHITPQRHQTCETSS